MHVFRYPVENIYDEAGMPKFANYVRENKSVKSNYI